MKRENAEEYTLALSQVVAGGWRQVALGERLGVPKALGLTTREWVDQKLGGYVRLYVNDRRPAVDELVNREGMSNRDAAEILGVSEKTVRNDLRALAGDSAPEDEKPQVTGSDGKSGAENSAPVAREEAEASTERMRASVHQWDTKVVDALLLGVPPAMLARHLLAVISDREREVDDREIADLLRDHVVMPRIDAILAWPHGGFYADDMASVDDELRDTLNAQRKNGG